MDFGAVNVESIGTLKYNAETEQSTFDLTMALRAPLETKPFEKIGEKIKEVQGLKAANFSGTTLEQALLEWTDQKTADKLKSDYTLKQEVKNVPKALQDAIVITGIKMVSHTKKGDNQRGLKTNTTQSAIVNIFNEPVMKYVSTRIFAEQRSNMGDRLGLFLDAPGGYEYFIDYDFRKDGVMSILTDDAEFNKEITEMKSDKKKSRKFIYDVTKNSAFKSQFFRVFK